MGDRGQRQIIVGMIVSDKMQKTVKVEVKRKVLHPIYKKYITKKKKFSADTGKFECSNGDTVKIAGFGTYKVAKRKARIGRNPRTGEQIQIAASQKVKFLPAKALKEVFNK